MNAAAVPWTRVLLVIWQERRNTGSMWFWWLLGLALGGAFAVVAAPLPPPLLPGVFAPLVLGLWIGFVLSVRAQNRPILARLVPGHVRALRRALLGAGLAITAVAALVGAPFGHAPLAAAGTVATLLALAWLVRFPALLLTLALVPTQSVWLQWPAVVTVRAAITQAWTDRPGLVAVAAGLALAGLVAASLRALVRDGGSRRRARDGGGARTACRASATSSSAQWPNARTGGRFGVALFRVQTAPYRWRLARASLPDPANVFGRALVGLGPGFHWSGLLGAALWQVVVTLAIFAVLWAGAAIDGPVAAWGLAAAALPLVGGFGLSALNALHHTRHEQALLMLLPGMPRGAALNHRLARHLLLCFAGCWLIVALLCAFPAPWLDAKSGWIWAVVLAHLPFVALLWRDWSTLRAPTAMTTPRLVFAALALGATLVALQVAAGVSVAQCAVGIVAVTLALLVWRWRRLGAAPSAFPAGRRPEAPTAATR